MSNIQDRVDDHEKRINQIEIGAARPDERLDALVKSTNNLKWSMFCFSFLMLMAIIYGAIGEKGFNQVKSTLPTTTIQQQTK